MVDNKRIVYISKYPDPETLAGKNDVWIETEFCNIYKSIQTAMRMRPDKIIIDYESYKDE